MIKILPSSQLENYKLIEDILEELYLSIEEYATEVYSTLDIYNLDSNALFEKLKLLGFENISLGEFLNLDVSSDYYKYISPSFYKAYRKLNQNRGNKRSLDYVLHSGNLINTLLKSNNKFTESSIFSSLYSFFDFNSFRDNQFEFSEIGDGYIIVPYSSNKGQKFKNFLAENPLIFNYLPAGYTFVFLSDYRNNFNGVLQYDNLLNTIDEENDFWEIPEEFEVVEELEIGDDVYVEYTHDVYYYNPFTFEDFGSDFSVIFHPRFPDQSVYEYSNFSAIYDGSFGYINRINNELNEYSLNEYYNGFGYSDLNNQLEYCDIWQGDYLKNHKDNEQHSKEFEEHVRGIKSINDIEDSNYSMYIRGESLYDNFRSRNQSLTARDNPSFGIPRKDVISDYQYVDCIIYTSFIPPIIPQSIGGSFNDDSYISFDDINEGGLFNTNELLGNSLSLTEYNYEDELGGELELSPEDENNTLFHIMDINTGLEEDIISPVLVEPISSIHSLSLDERELIELSPNNSFEEINLYETSQQQNTDTVIDIPESMNIMSLIDESISYDYGFMGELVGEYIPTGTMGEIRASYSQPMVEINALFGNMSDESPIIAGVTTSVPTGTTKLKSKYYWTYNFANVAAGGIGNPYMAVYYPEVLTSYSTNSTVPNSDVVSAYIGGTLADQPIIDVSLYASQNMNYYIGKYNDKPEFYTTNAPYNFSDFTLVGTLVEFTSNYTGTTSTEWDLPSDLYSISGTTITWNDTHTMYSLFYGKEVIPE